MKKLLIAGAVAFAGCTTTPIAIEDATPVPADRVMRVNFAEAGSSRFRIQVARDTGFAGRGCTLRIYLDDEPAADIEAGELVTLDVVVGRRQLGAGPSPKSRICSAFGSDRSERRDIDVDGKAGERRLFRVGIGSNGPLLAPAAPLK